MDEMLQIITGLWTHDTFSYEGKHFKIPEISIVPRPVQTPRPRILVAGGLVPAGASKHITTSKGYTAHRSLERAATLGDGVMTAYRSAPGLDISQIVASWKIVCDAARAAGRDPESLTFAHQDHMYIDMEATPERLSRVLAGFSYNAYEATKSIYLMGRPDELIPRFQARIDAGVEEITFGLLRPDPNQLDLFMREIRPHLRVA
jgi:alkanesulfonate monooxygenase SsuD/methylene tetrahydromethanopterin reductase-like flavin-dependent oxidoreductase (luciferase family)